MSTTDTHVWQEVTYVLTYPITIDGGEPITAITLREPDLEALEAMSDLGLEDGKRLTVRQTAAIVAALSRLPLASVRKLHRDDFGAIVELAAPLAFGRPAGDRSAS